jgi:hypothetical protein
VRKNGRLQIAREYSGHTDPRFVCVEEPERVQVIAHMRLAVSALGRIL